MKQKRMLLCLCVVLLLAGTAGAVIYRSTRPGPEERISEYMALINTGDFVQMYRRLSDQSRDQITEEQFVDRNQKIYQGIEARNVAVTVEETVRENGKKRVEYSVSMDTAGGSVSFDGSAVFGKNREFGAGPEWEDSLIFPGLSAGDRVQVRASQGTRGRILDRDGEVLAEDGKASSVGLVPGKITDRDSTIRAMAELLDIMPEAIEKKLAASWVKEDSFVPVRTVPASEGELKKALLALPGVMITNVDVRVYPKGEAFAHVTGYVQSVTAEDLEKNPRKNYTSQSVIGRTGMESLYEDTLRAVAGCEVYIVDAKGKRKSSIIARPARNGSDVKLTLDSGLQSSLYAQMKQDKGCAVVLDPANGETLALVSTPSYDPNAFVVGMTEKQWQTLNEDPAKPMYNRFKTAVCPGSSFKPVTGGVGLDSGMLQAEEDLGHSGLAWQKDSGWGNYKVTTLKEYSTPANLRNAMVYSDNIYFAKAALKIGAEKLAAGLRGLGFGESIPYPFGLEASSFGKDGTFTGEIDLADSGFGQGAVLVNPVHMASIYSAFANGGSMIQPWLVYGGGSQAKYFREQAFSPETAETIRANMIQVVEDPAGTGHSARIPGLTLAGKTGTAEIKQSQDDQTGTELGWFNAFAADGDVQRLAVVIIEDVKERGGSHYVIPMTKSVFENLK